MRSRSADGPRGMKGEEPPLASGRLIDRRLFAARKALGPLGRGRDKGPLGGWDTRRDGEPVDAEPGDAIPNERGCVGGVYERGTKEAGCLGGERLRISPSSWESLRGGGGEGRDI